MRSPDAAWVEKGRLEGLLRSAAQYAACGARLGWLIDPSERVEVYRRGQPVESLIGMSAVSGEPVCSLKLDQESWFPVKFPSRVEKYARFIFLAYGFCGHCPIFAHSDKDAPATIGTLWSFRDCYWSSKSSRTFSYCYSNLFALRFVVSE